MSAEPFQTTRLQELTAELAVGGEGASPVRGQGLINLLSALAFDLNAMIDVTVATILDNHQLTKDSTTFQKLDPNGADRDLRLPNPSDMGLKLFIIVNGADAAESIVVKTFSEGATVGTLAQNKAGFFILNNGAWVKLCTLTITI